MAKSRDTFNKQEVEKNKEKKRKEKEQRREERRANAKSGASLEDMMAYVDENGNITSTPPDPTKKKVIREEDIVIGVPRQEHGAKADHVRKGRVTFFNDSKGYGFIKDQDTQESIFVHVNAVGGPIKEGDKVSFEVEMGPKGPNAVRVKVGG
ncbi:cold shock domain-containing protein [Fulvivirgaceae bacterium PWU4]|uniref:Cold shock domain-containing protein n=1 Tax=Chryseosolibacter histidini TaxID=2782349 RepID=A0AAP2GS03_9BACT|nr:cold shock domain-containing protein [Chryseosolibacter histidini]MBT1700600.1 cold shock domain-containing protein [Chryseosolibacter histidini]